MNSSAQRPRGVDVIVVGAGWSGLYALHKFRSIGLDVIGLEAADNVGGTWFWNRYPGARCDVPSLMYSFTFTYDYLPDWKWSEQYAQQSEIEAYANAMADALDVRRLIRFNTQVQAAEYDSECQRWRVRTNAGEILETGYLVLATGGYSKLVRPPIPGLDDFKGRILFTADWRQAPPDFNGKRVGVIGTGSSGVQTVTALSAQPVKNIYVFQRTANYAVPARLRSCPHDEQERFRENATEYWRNARSSGAGSSYDVPSRAVARLSEPEFRAHLDALWDHGGLAFRAGLADLMTDEGANRRVGAYICDRIRERVADPQVAEALCPKDQLVGLRRLIVESGYYEAFNQGNVHLVNIAKTPIERATETGLVVEGREIELDVIVFATGFDSGTGAMLGINPSGLNEERLSSRWAEGPSTYLGMMISGFPNLFSINGPGGPSIRSHMILGAEQQLDWIADLLIKARSLNVTEIDARQASESSWTAHVAEVASRTLVMRQPSQYMGANIPGKPHVYLAYLGGFAFYQSILEDVKQRSYAGLSLRSQGQPVLPEADWSSPPDPKRKPQYESAVV